MEIVGFILLYFVLGFITTIIIHKSGDWNPIEIESSYDAVFITLVMASALVCFGNYDGVLAYC